MYLVSVAQEFLNDVFSTKALVKSVYGVIPFNPQSFRCRVDFQKPFALHPIELLTILGCLCCAIDDSTSSLYVRKTSIDEISDSALEKSEVRTEPCSQD